MNGSSWNGLPCWHSKDSGWKLRLWDMSSWSLKPLGSHCLVQGGVVQELPVEQQEGDPR